MRGTVLLALLPACASPDPPAPSPAPTPRAEPFLAVHPAATRVEGLILEWADRGDRSALQRARREAEGLLAREPGSAWARHLAVLAARADADPAGEAALRAGFEGVEAAVHAWWFERPGSEVTALLRCNHMASCLRAEGRFNHHRANGPLFANETDLDPRAPDGTVSCGGVTLDPVTACPADFHVFEKFAWTTRARDRLTRWTADGRPVTGENLARAVGIREGSRVADIGAEIGWFTWPFARVVGPSGTVWAVEIDPRYTACLEGIATGAGLSQVRVVEAPSDDVSLPVGQVDVAFVAFVFQEIWQEEVRTGTAPGEGPVHPFLASIRASLAPGGRLVTLEHLQRGEAVDRTNYALDEMYAFIEAAGFRRAASLDLLRPRKALDVFVLEAPDEPAAPATSDQAPKSRT